MDRRKLLTFSLLALLPGLAHAQGPGGPGGGGGNNQRPGQGSGGGNNRPGGGGSQPSRPGGSGGSQPGRPGGSGGSQPSRPGGGSQPSRPGGGSQPSRPGGGSQPGRPGGGSQPGRPGGGGSSRPPTTGPHRPGAGRPNGFRPVRGPTWRYPSGYRYRRWTIGAVLPALFLTSAYFYDDYWRMGLSGPPYGYRWVRYGPDLVLVETRTGHVADVIYGAFY